MKKLIGSFLLIAIVSCAAANRHRPAGDDKPRVFALDAGNILDNRKKIGAMDPLLMPAYRQLIRDADESLKFGPVSVMEKKNQPPSGDKHDYMSLAPYFWPDPTKPDGLPYIRKDGETNPEVKEYKDKEYLPKLCAEVNTLGLAYFFSGDSKYASHASKLLRVWFLDTATRMNPNLEFGQAVKGVNTGRGAGMIDIRHFVKLVDGIGLISNSKSWTKQDQEGMKQWFTRFLDWMQTSKIGIDEMNAENNHGAWYEAVRLSLALFVNDMELAKKSVANAQKRLDMQMNNDGFFPKELARTTSLHYSTFVMDAFLAIAQMAKHTGTDFYNYKSPSGKSLQKAFDALHPFLADSRKWTGQQIKTFDTGEGIGVLIEGYKKFNCKTCMSEIGAIAGDKKEKLRIHLIY